MSQITNIVLTGNNGRTESYMIKLLPGRSDTYACARTEWSDIDPHHIIVFKDTTSDEDSYLCNIKNDWYVGYEYEGKVSLSDPIKTNTLRLYFPDYSADTYDKGCKYILTAYTYVYGVKVELGSFLFRRNDSLACAPESFISSDKYYEYIDFNIASPFDVQNNPIIQRVCGKRRSDAEMTISLEADEENSEMTASLEVNDISPNDISSELYLSLQVVENLGDHYIKKIGWTNGQNSIQIVDYQDLKVDLFFNKTEGSLHYEMLFNNDVADTIKEYITKTYDVQNFAMKVDCVVLDDEDAYIALEYEPDEGEITEVYESLFHEELVGPSGQYDAHNNSLSYVDTFWSKWKDGMWFKGSIEFINKDAYPDYKNSEYEPFVTIFSNAVPITQDVYARMNTVDDDFPKYIDLDMNNINITVVNKTEQNITTVTPNDSTKSHIIQPIFYQTRNISQVMVHPEVTENICINLDSYKANVKTFSVKIENGVFGEIGRTTKGVIFKIVGNDLQNQVKEGTLYVLDQDGILVTTGKYIYV